MSSDIKIAYRKLQIIYENCSTEVQKKKLEESKLTQFARSRKELNRQIKEIRMLLKERETLLASKKNSTTTNRAREAAEQSFRIRAKIKEAKDEFNKLRLAFMEEERAFIKKKKPNEQLKLEYDAKKEVVTLAQAHLDEVENLEKKRFMGPTNERVQLILDANNSSSALPSARPTTKIEVASPERDALLKGARALNLGSTDPTSTTLPDLEDISKEMEMVQSQNNEIDAQLHQIGVGVVNLKEIAINIGNELDNQNNLISDIEGKVEKTGEHLNSLNASMKKTVDGVMKGDKFLVNCVLITLLLALAAFISSYFV